MRRRLKLTLGEIGFMVATRAALGAGIGALALARLPMRIRRAVGLGLVALGVVTTVPILRRLREAR
jgi:hypothetical protein